MLAKLTMDGELLWARAWGTAATEQTNGVHIDADGNILTAGLYISADQRYEALLLKYTPDGDLLWARQLETGGDTKFWDGRALDGATTVIGGSCNSAQGRLARRERDADRAHVHQRRAQRHAGRAGGGLRRAGGLPDSPVGTADSGAGNLDALLVGWDWDWQR